MIPITKANVLRFIPCTEARLNQAFLPSGRAVSEKKYRKLSDRLDVTIRTCLRKGLFTSRSFTNDAQQVIVFYYRISKEPHPATDRQVEQEIPEVDRTQVESNSLVGQS